MEGKMILALDIRYILFVVLGSLACAVFIIFFLYLLVSFISFKMLVQRPKKPIEMNSKNPFISLMGEDAGDFIEFVNSKIPSFLALPLEDIEVVTGDGLTLRGSFLRASADSKRTIICIHSYRTTPEFDFSPIVPFLRNNNFNILFVSNRAHGKSDGKYISFGVKDHLDVLNWIEKANSLVTDSEIYLYGIGMGAATVMMSSALDLPSSVKCAIEDSGYTSAFEIFSYQIRQLFNLRTFPIVSLIDSFCKIADKFDLRKTTALGYVAKSTIPILFIHGENDLFVPTFMGEACFEACTAAKDKLFVEGAGHTQSYFKCPELYEETLLSFINSHSKLAPTNDQESQS